MGFSKRQYKIVSCPSEDQAKTNLAYVSQNDPAVNSHILIAGSLVATAAGDPRVPAGCLALNALHRKFGRVSTGEPVDVEPFVLPAAGMDIVLLTLEVNYLSKKGRGGELDAQELSKNMARKFSMQVLSVGQEISAEFLGTTYLVKVLSILTLQDGEQCSVPRGLLINESSYVFDAPPQSGIKITNQRAQAANQLFKSKEFNFEKLGIGGLNKQFDQIFRRAFASRVFPTAVVEKLGIHHVRGVLLYGPPGTGKTLIARQIGKMLNGKEPKIVNGPEVLSKYVGEAEENVRKLFADAERDMKSYGDASELHVIIFDELDSICKQRGSVKDGTGVHDSLVNQLLSKIDGVDSLNNVLLIGMTNRKDMLDEALMRPGRLEVQIEIGLPDEEGRLQILKIHTSRMAANSFLGRDVDLYKLAEVTKNFSGAEIEGLVKSAASFALNRQVDVNDLSKPIDEDNIKVTDEDFMHALDEVKPAFGSQTETLSSYCTHGMIDYGVRYAHLLNTCRMLVNQVGTSERTPLLSCLLEGPAGSGKTALAATLALESTFPYAKIISADSMVGYSELSKVSAIAKVFDDAYKSPVSMIILDDIERLLEFVAIGPRFSNAVLQTILVLLKKPPPLGKKVLIVATTSLGRVMEEMDVSSVFNVVLNVPPLDETEVKAVLKSVDAFAPGEVDAAVACLTDSKVPIKRLLTLVELAQQGTEENGGGHIGVETWSNLLSDLNA